MTPLVVVRAAALASVIARLARSAPARSLVEQVEATGTDAGLPSISVVIPARDEADRVGDAVRSVADAPGVDEVIVIDDDSTDQTVAVAASAGARVIAAGRRPAGWTGKSWAVERGVVAASGEWIVTLDADARADAGLPEVVVSRAISDGADLLSVAGRFTAASPSAQWLHASMLTTLVYRYGAPGTSNRPERTIANGQCLTFRRRTFLAWGGFGPVATAAVEDVALARHLARDGRRVAFLDASALLAVVPYPSLRTTWGGWGRSLGLPGVDSDVRRAVDVMVLALTMPLPFVRLLTRRADALDLIALAVRAGTLVGTRRAYERRGSAYWSSPLADAAAVAAVALGGFRRRHVWRGRMHETPRTPERTAGR